LEEYGGFLAHLKIHGQYPRRSSRDGDKTGV